MNATHTAVHLTEEQKIAILLASLDEKVAASILQQLEPDVMSRVANAIRRLGIVSGEDRRKALVESSRSIMAMGQAVQGDEKTVNSLLTRAIGEKRAAALLQDTSTKGPEAFSFLDPVSPEQIVTNMEGEPPAVIGVLLTYLPAEKAGMVLSLLGKEVRRQVVMFMCKSGAPTGDAIDTIRQHLEGKMGHAQQAKAVENRNKVDVMSSILQHIDRSVEEETLTAVQDVSETLANEVRDRLFIFEDIAKLGDPAVRRILQEVDTAALAVALRNASVELRNKFFANMSKRAVEGLKEEMEFSQKLKLSEIQAKQREIITAVRALEASGQVVLREGQGDEYV